MQTAPRNGTALVALLFALLCLCTTATAQTESDASSSVKTSGTVSANSSILTAPTRDERNTESRQTTCRTGTVNYITHSLPQQCLTRSSPTSNSTASGTLTSSSTSDSSTHEEPTATSAETSSISTTQSEPEFETDSPLDNANFLSFEEWKKQNLAKVGQSPDHVGQKSRSAQDKAPRNIPGIDNALDVLGEDSEIELDFGGFGRQDSVPSSTTTTQPTVASDPALRSKDAGKTCKERSNYASFDCAATVLKSNPKAKSASAVLIENKDSYMLNICSSPNKFLIVELCNDILIDTIVLANYEFFSSIFRNFRVSVSDRYPVKPDRWRELGVFEARNTRSVQAFLVEQPLIWARYLRIEFLNHYGNEYYCPVSLLRVHGTTMMEEFRHQEELARGEISDDLEESVMPDASESAAQEPPQSSYEADKSVVVESATPVRSSSQTIENSSVSSVSPSGTAPAANSEASISTKSEASTSTNSTGSPSTSIQTSSDSSSTSTRLHSASTVLSNSTSAPQTTPENNTQKDVSKSSSPTAVEVVSTAKNSSDTAQSSNSTVTTSTQHPSAAITSTHVSSSTTSDSSPKSASTNSSPQTTSSSIASSKASSIPVKSSSATEGQQKSGTLTISSAHSNPTTQESFFKSIHKRLQMLESNATLSLQYIEEQSRILRDAFIKVEKRQIKKTESFLENLNTTVFAELQDFKQQYDQLWQSTVIELENHRDQYQREILAVSARLSIVADELVFQKRMAIVQSTILMLCLGLVLFVRVGGGTGLDVPIIQQMVAKSQFGRNSYYSPLNSPSPDQSSPPGLHSFRRRRSFWRSSVDTSASARPTSRGNEDFSRDPQHVNPDLRFEPPTPTHQANNVTDGEDGVMISPTTQSIHEDGSYGEEGVESEEETDDSSSLLPQETQSSPSTPNGSRDLKTLQSWPAAETASETGSNDPKMPDMRTAA